MHLQNGSGDLAGNEIIHNEALDSVCLALAAGNQHGALCLHDVAHAHGDSTGGNFFLAGKETGICFDGALVQSFGMGAGNQIGRRFVEADVAVNADEYRWDGLLPAWP